MLTVFFIPLLQSFAFFFYFFSLFFFVIIRLLTFQRVYFSHYISSFILKSYSFQSNQCNTVQQAKEKKNADAVPGVFFLKHLEETLSVFRYLHFSVSFLLHSLSANAFRLIDINNTFSEEKKTSKFNEILWKRGIMRWYEPFWRRQYIFFSFAWILSDETMFLSRFRFRWYMLRVNIQLTIGTFESR